MSTRRKTPPGPPSIPASVDPARGIQLLSRQIEAGRRLLGGGPINSNDYRSWETLTNDFLIKAFGTDSPNVSRVLDVGKYGMFPMDAGEEYWQQRRRDSLTTQIRTLESLVELLQTEIELQTPAAEMQHPEPSGHGVFLVHGHDEAVLHATARFLEHLDVDVTVLREQPSQGRTIIEKFIDYSDVGFAVVLLTPDDKGGSAAAPPEGLRARARQNVILELGFFLGKLGRKRVCALYREGVEIPSDYSGVLFVPLDDAGAWKLTLAREMKAAGINVDMNKAV